MGYLTVDPSRGEGYIDWEWLSFQPGGDETNFVRHVSLDQPLDVRLDGRTRLGVIYKPDVG